MRALGLPQAQRLTELAPVILRLGLGLVFAVHGWQKLTNGPAGFAGMLTGLGVAAPAVFSWLVTIAELVGGIMLVLGLLTRLVTLPLIATIIGAIALVKTDLGIIAPAGTPMPGAELDIALLAGLVALLLMGPGRLSIDHMVGVDTPIRNKRSRHSAADSDSDSDSDYGPWIRQLEQDGVQPPWVRPRRHAGCRA